MPSSAFADWLGSAQFEPGAERGEGPDRFGYRVGRGRSSSSPRATCGRGCTPRACAGSRWCSGRSAAATRPAGTATRCPASTSRGAPAPPSSSRSSRPRTRRTGPGCSTCASGTGSRPWSPRTAGSPGCRAEILGRRRRRARRALQPHAWPARWSCPPRPSSSRAAASARTTTWPARAGPPTPGTSRSGCSRASRTRRTGSCSASPRGVGGRARARGPHVALPGGHREPLAGLVAGTASGSCPARPPCGSTPTAAACPARCSPASTRSARCST